MRSTRPLTAVAVLLVTALGGTLASSTIVNAAPAEGDRAVARAADRYDVSESGLQSRLQEDPSLRLTSTGVAYFVHGEHDHSHKSAPAIAPAPLADTFLLHSKAGAQRTIYLDFNGQNVTNTAWNGPSGGNVPNGTHPAWTLDGDAATFNDTERTQIQSIFYRVAEDFAPFDIDVTTQDPGLAALDRTNAGDLVFGTRALITPSSSAATAICNNMCGGVAFVGVFNHFAGLGGDPTTHEGYQPAWIFPQNLGPNDVKSIAEGVTHEVGHTLGLDHDGTSALGYYAGHAGWAPIMGSAYNEPISQFALNDYPDARLGDPGFPSLQPNSDDLVTVTQHGPSFRSDEPGTATGNAGAVPAGSAYIHNRTDVDYFALGTCSGTVTVNANGAEFSPNLDIEVQLLNAGNTVLDTDNPTSAKTNFDVASGMDASASAAALPSGQYFARVDGVGRGAPGNGTGYTDYGSLGAYTLSVAGCAGPAVTAPSAPQNLAGSYLGNEEVQLTWSAPANDGGAAVTSYNGYMDGNPIGSVPSPGAVVTGVPSGVHNFEIAAVNSAGEGPRANVSVDATDAPPQAKPGRPRIGDATAGKQGGKLTAKIRWQPPSAAANPAINGYQVLAYRQNSNGKYVKFSTSSVLPAGFRSIVFTTNTKARLKFAVKARNSLGFGSLSAKSNAVRPR